MAFQFFMTGFFELSLIWTSQTPHKLPPKMSSLGGRLQEVVAYEFRPCLIKILPN